MAELLPLTIPRRVRLRVEDYRLLDAAGAFATYAKTELIDGEIVGMNAEYSRHLRVKTLLFRAIAAALETVDGGLGAWVEGSVAIPPEAMPQPDILVTRGLPEDGPVPVEMVRLLVEVADSTLSFDLETKARLYAGARVPEYWVVDVNARMIHQMWAPTGETYDGARGVAFGGVIEAVTIAGLAVATGGL